MDIIGIIADTSISSTCTRYTIRENSRYMYVSDGIVIPYCAHLYYTVRCMRRWYTFYELVHTTHTHIHTDNCGGTGSGIMLVVE